MIEILLMMVIKKSITDFDNSNEIKIFKNKKIVYVNKDLLNKYSTSRSINNIKKTIIIFYIIFIK